MRNHELKCHLAYYAAVRKGIKTFELRLNDRAYQLGDTLTLNEWDEIEGKPTGKSLQVKVCYILSGITVGANTGSYVIMSFQNIFNVIE